MTNDKCFFSMYRTATISSRLVYDIFPVNAAGFEDGIAPDYSKIGRLTDYVAQYPKYLPEICDLLESLLKSNQKSLKLGLLSICLTTVRELLSKCAKLNLDYIVQPTAVNILLHLFRSHNIKLLSKGASFFFEYSEICSKHDFSVLLRPVIEICEKNDYQQSLRKSAIAHEKSRGQEGQLGSISERSDDGSVFTVENISEVNITARSFLYLTKILS